MSTRSLIDRTGNNVDPATLEPFLTAFRGAVIQDGDADYESARRIWNASIDKRPGLIVRCSGLADVITAVRFARDHGLLVAIRGGGHNVGGRALCDGGVVIDLSRMKGIHVDPAARRARSSLASYSASWIARRTFSVWRCQRAWCRRLAWQV